MRKAAPAKSKAKKTATPKTKQNRSRVIPLMLLFLAAISIMVVYKFFAFLTDEANKVKLEVTTEVAYPVALGNFFTEDPAFPDMVSCNLDFATVNYAVPQDIYFTITMYYRNYPCTLHIVDTTAPAAEGGWTAADLKKLKNTKNFTRSAIDHIFLGEINSRGVGAGYHYEGIEDSPGRVIEGTRSKPDIHGVYRGKVEVDGVKKTGNKGYSTFYPLYMTPQDVVDAINQAYENAELIGNDLYAGITDDGIEIDMYMTKKGKITTAYPVMED